MATVYCRQSLCLKRTCRFLIIALFAVFTKILYPRNNPATHFDEDDSIHGNIKISQKRVIVILSIYFPPNSHLSLSDKGILFTIEHVVSHVPADFRDSRVHRHDSLFIHTEVC